MMRHKYSAFEGYYAWFKWVDKGTARGQMSRWPQETSAIKSDRVCERQALLCLALRTLVQPEPANISLCGKDQNY